MDLFNGIADKESLTFDKLGGKIQNYKKGDVVLAAGEYVDDIYLVDQGVLSVENNDYQGDVFIISQVKKGGIFGGAFAFSAKKCTSDVVAYTDCRLISIKAAKIYEAANSGDEDGIKLTQNLIRLLATKSVDLLTKISHISAKTTRLKTLSYLATQAKLAYANTFEIPFSRQQLADYLGVERSALSKELSQMQKDGLIIYHKNKFTLLSASTDYPNK